MNNLRWKIIKHSEIVDSLLKEIAMIKDQHWMYGLESQLNWIKENVQKDDYHLCGFLDQKLVAYLAVVEVRVKIDTNEDYYLGLSNVCVSKDSGRKGFGSKLVQQANQFISSQGRTGILLCKESLVPFYQKNAWSLVEYEKAIIDKEMYEKEIMIFSKNEVKNAYSIQIERNF